ncbi:conjugal transfer protein [Pseudoclavibacter sp. RFBJ3]|uniref:type IV secretory system conjugative DNA transfer family protein n=1 Tax=unclassified Pseudoclavibacter TaxID=2615177 RepID=UPI000CE73441|nr:MULTISPECIES: TraM recognition domain-containing protein [unclassified Pseudoclavibacter]PPF81685.1 conjugal transfer protein [Pseudoclavibacter sp. RFBJ5]PPF91015.1 conjugal transfer protein [Pseudoclavibacter sp. RFBJ3]PPG00291.1 conjugal transfer protein [Pseudoclavibacter sp. RFBH5]PPG20150.1 conjugal transfer protein [Pseudoclavibacter sp. RFBI4]
MSAPRKRGPGGMAAEAVLLWIGLTAAVVAIGGTNLSVRVAANVERPSEPLPDDVFALFFGVLRGSVRWSATATGVAMALALGLALAVSATLLLARGHRTGSRRLDRSAALLGRGREIAGISARGARASSQRLGVAGPIGVRLGTSLPGGSPVFGSWEDMQINISGPRTGKSTAFAIPAIVEAPGAVIVTSNKRDVVDATRGVRAEAGRVWVFDPQGVAGDAAEWWWDPLSYVTDEVQAGKLAEHFASGSREQGSRADAFFDPAAKDLLAALLLAGALAGTRITEVYRWVTRPGDDDAVGILRDAGYRLIADQLEGVISAPDRQRGGIYGTAQQMASCLTNGALAPWITVTGELDTRPRFDPHEFVRGTDTLYSLSREGQGTTGPLVTALTVAVAEAAEELAAASLSGRLARPLLGVLDEAANVCRWRSLPDLYSHYGSRGIVLITILQSWSQGAEVWGEGGMRKLWSAANIKIYGGGVSEAAFLDELSKLVGDHDRELSSLSYGRGHRTVSKQLHRERILDVAELSALPRGRALVLASGSRPTLIRTRSWMQGPHAARIRASITAHQPGGDATGGDGAERDEADRDEAERGEETLP